MVPPQYNFIGGNIIHPIFHCMGWCYKTIVQLKYAARNKLRIYEPTEQHSDDAQYNNGNRLHTVVLICFIDRP